MSPQYDNVLEAALALPSDEQKALADELQARSEELVDRARQILATKTKSDDGGPDYGGLIARDKSPGEYERRTIQAIKAGIASAETKQGYTPDEVRAMLREWITK